jgi:hypothetical protein
MQFFTSRRRRLTGVTLLAGAALLAAPIVSTAASATAATPKAAASSRSVVLSTAATPQVDSDTPANANFVKTWGHLMTNKKPVWFSSPGVAELDGNGPSVIVGDVGGKVHAFNATTGANVSGWPYTTKGAVRVMSTPSTFGTGSKALVFVGVGASQAPTKGGYLALTAHGNKKWYRQPSLLPGNKGGTRGVMSSLSVGKLSVSTSVVGGAMGQMQYAMRASNGKTLSGWPWLQADTNFSTPALADYRKLGHPYVIEGGDSTAGRSYYQTYSNGGHIRILRPNGNAGKQSPNDGLICQYNTNQVVQSSPAVGNFLTGGKTGIVTGTGTYYANRSDTKKIIAINTNCKRQWSRTLDSASLPSPALADVEGDGDLDVVTISKAGTVYALSGFSGKVLWHRKLAHGTDGAVTTFQAPNSTFQYILAPTGQGVYLLDGRDGHIVQRISDFRLRSSATVTRDSDGRIGITVAGATGHSQGIIEHFALEGSSVDTVQTNGAWPMFHHDPQLTGYSVLAKP